MSETAVFRSGGHQFHVQVGDVLEIPTVEGDAGNELAFPEVLMYQAPGNVRVGTPTVPGAKVLAEVVAQTQAPKINGFKYKPKKHYKKAFGHRQKLTRVRITAIEGGGAE